MKFKYFYGLLITFFFQTLPQAFADRPVVPVWDEEAPVEEAFLQAKAQTPPEASGLKVLWWNIKAFENDKLNQAPAKGWIHHNLSILMHGPAAPAVVFLGEYIPIWWGLSLRQELRKTHPYYFFIPYHAQSKELGIGVFSKIPLKLARKNSLTWYHEQASHAYWLEKDPDDAKTFERTFIDFTLKFQEKKYHLLPIHLAQPWTFMKKEEGSIFTGLNMVLGIESPLGVQAQELKKILRTHYQNEQFQEKLLMLGDFNLIKTSRSYLHIAENLSEAFSGFPGTYPAASDSARLKGTFKYWHPKIDHAFANSQTQFSQSAVLPLKGSDHYALYVEVK